MARKQCQSLPQEAPSSLLDCRNVHQKFETTRATLESGIGEHSILHATARRHCLLSLLQLLGLLDYAPLTNKHIGCVDSVILWSSRKRSKDLQ